MTAIAGISRPNAEEQVKTMLDSMAYRAPAGQQIATRQGITVGIGWPKAQQENQKTFEQAGVAEDAVSESQFARAEIQAKSFILSRDMLGAAPLYYGLTQDGALCFASEVKALLDLVDEVQELSPGCRWKDGTTSPQEELAVQEPVEETPLTIASEVRRKLEAAVLAYVRRGYPFGVWLSGGLDSSIIAALARPHAGELHTFSAGFPYSDDLEHARLVARYIRASHHEITPAMKELTKALPEVIYHLEAYDVELVRSSLMNYFVAKATADFVPAVFSGEGSDELFAGDEDLKRLAPEELPVELIARANRLHHTTLQRVDRCAAAFGLVPYLPFLDEEVVAYAGVIPATYKINNGLEKWILRRAFYDLLPERVLRRQKARFWEGAGVYRRLTDYAEEVVSDAELRDARNVGADHPIESKEQLLYYRIFQEHFGKLENHAWVGFLQ